MPVSDKDIIIIIISATAVLLILLVFIISFLFIYKNRQALNEIALQQVQEKYNQELLKTQLEIREQTLKNVSEEIHDNMGQVLSLVVLNLSAVELTDIHSATIKIEKSAELVKRVVTDLRNLSKTLDYENIVRTGLASVVSYELDLLEKTGHYSTVFTCTGNEIRIDSARETIAYRIVQEALNNVIKHARATTLTVIIAYTQEDISISIADNGVGFEEGTREKQPLQKTGAGLNNMKNRAKMMGADFEIYSSPEKGTSVVLTIPVKATQFADVTNKSKSV